MTEVVSVKFKGRGKAYYFAPGDCTLRTGEAVVVETAKGLEIGRCRLGNHFVADERVVPPLRPVVRKATADDLRIEELCRKREKEAFKIGQQKIAARKLDMKLVDVECNFEGNKIIFFFTSDGRVDFRELVRDLATVFRSRIELRQIGVRDEAKMLGGLGICGRPFCCHQFLNDFQPVSTKMAKVQNMSLNPTKISGICGRLMCCLRYEQAAYEDLVKNTPKNNAFVETVDGYGNVVQQNLLRQQVKVRLDGNGGEAVVKTYPVDEVAAVPGGRPKPGEPLPHVLQVKPKAKKEEEPPQENAPWTRPVLFAGMEPNPADAPTRPVPEEPTVKNRRNRGRRGGKPEERKSQGEQKPRNNRGEKGRTGRKKRKAPERAAAQPGRQERRAEPQPEASAGRTEAQKRRKPGQKAPAAGRKAPGRQVGGAQQAAGEPRSPGRPGGEIRRGRRKEKKPPSLAASPGQPQAQDGQRAIPVLRQAACNYIRYPKNDSQPGCGSFFTGRKNFAKNRKKCFTNRKGDGIVKP